MTPRGNSDRPRLNDELVFLLRMVLFDHVLYYLSPSLPDKTRIHLVALLDSNGGIAAPIERATHIISNTIDFEGCDLLKREVVCVTVCFVNMLRNTRHPG